MSPIFTKIVLLLSFMLSISSVSSQEETTLAHKIQETSSSANAAVLLRHKQQQDDPRFGTNPNAGRMIETTPEDRFHELPPELEAYLRDQVWSKDALFRSKAKKRRVAEMAKQRAAARAQADKDKMEAAVHKKEEAGTTNNGGLRGGGSRKQAPQQQQQEPTSTTRNTHQ